MSELGVHSRAANGYALHTQTVVLSFVAKMVLKVNAASSAPFMFMFMFMFMFIFMLPCLMYERMRDPRQFVYSVFESRVPKTVTCLVLQIGVIQPPAQNIFATRQDPGRPRQTPGKPQPVQTDEPATSICPSQRV